MKKYVLIVCVMLTFNAFAQLPNDILNVLITNGTITQAQADSLRAEAAIKQQDADANKKSFMVTAARAIQLSGYMHVRYQNFSEENKKDGFDIRRARLDLTGNLTPYLSLRLLTDFADKPKIMDAYAEVKINDYFNITIGQFRVPFSLENLTPVRRLELIDFSQAVDAMVSRNRDVIGNQNGRDIGIQLGGAIWKKNSMNYIEYRVGVLNGSGINVADTANEGKDIVGRIILNPLKGLSIGSSYYNGWGKAINPGSKYIGKSQPRSRYGFDINYTTARWTLRGEYIRGVDGSTDKAGWYAWAAYYILPQKLQVLAKYDNYDPNLSTEENNTTNYVTGLNLNFNSWSRLQAFYTFREEQGESIDNDYVSIQYQIGF